MGRKKVKDMPRRQQKAVWAKYRGEIEYWKGTGKVRVIRTDRGKIIAWKKP